MDGGLSLALRRSEGLEIVRPATQTMPFVFSSPHSGCDYPARFLAASRLDPVRLRRSEDFRVDQLFLAAPRLGAPLLRALFPRAYVDVNRDAYELDPSMFLDRLPAFVDSQSPRVRAGFGTPARIVADGQEIYAGRLTFAEARARIEHLYRPYHRALAGLIGETRRRFGHCVLIDCHSMPSVGGPADRDAGRARVDFVLGDAHGQSASPRLVEAVESALRARGYTTRRNLPYSGGHITRSYGQPAERVQALQIEINRGLYMDEAALCPTVGFAGLAEDLGHLIEVLAQLEPVAAAA